MRAPTAEPAIRENAKRNDLANSGAAAATANKEKSVEEARTLLCKLTDLELSGAPPLANREADQERPTRPLERLVSLHAHSAEEANTTWPERRRCPKSREPASRGCRRAHRR